MISIKEVSDWQANKSLKENPRNSRHYIGYDGSQNKVGYAMVLEQPS